VSGSMTAVVGPNGAGKSTFLRALVGLVKIESGSVNFENCSTRDLAYLPQQVSFDKTFPLSVYEVACQGFLKDLGFFQSITLKMKEEALEALEMVGLSGKIKSPAGTLSVGQFQRLLFARLMLQKGKFLLLDEPFASLDTKTTEDLLQLLHLWNQSGKTVICVLHDLAQAKEYFPETIYIARDLIGWGKTEKILTEDNQRKAFEKMDDIKSEAEELCEAPTT
ncbi:MAG: metal ABC transporter ATP-binding protein, partial [Pseudobdellovibrionaceae bacterium]